MTDAPEKIWAEPFWQDGDKWGHAGLYREEELDVEYTRTDVALAMVAAAYEAAWRVIWPRPLNGPPRKPTADDGPEYRQAYKVQSLVWRDAQDIRSLTPDDAQAALERVKREVRNEALREAAASIWRHRKVVPVSFLEAMEANILALMEDTGNE